MFSCSSALCHACLKQRSLTCPAASLRSIPWSSRPYARTCRSSNWTCGRSTGNPRTRKAWYSVNTASPLSRLSHEDVTVACRSNGEITLNIFHPRVQDDPTLPVILFLPTAPRAADSCGVHDEQIIATLLAASNGTIVRVNYRAGNGVHYPTPVHDVLAGYDYVKERFALESWTTRSGRVKRAPLRMGVCGQLVGASLATMLGLTESHLAQDRVAAIALNCPVTDWLFPEKEQTLEDVLSASMETSEETQAKPARRPRKSKARLPSWETYEHSPHGLSTKDLEALRTLLFKKPEHYFDPFASPIHFFRSPSLSLAPPLDPTTMSESEDPLSLLSPAPPKPRKAHRNFPPSNSTLVLPHVRLGAGRNPLADANEEFVKVLRRSVMRTAMKRRNFQAEMDRFEEDGDGEEDRLEDAIQEAERRVEYHIAEGSGLWGSNKEDGWKSEVEAVGRWFKSVLK